MKRQVKVFIEGKELDLFDDEQIQVSSSVQNVYDISKSNTDISQSFTVPGTAYNNYIFEHFYETDVDGTIDHRLRRDGYIEIDLTTFKRGKIQLDKANVEKGKIKSYSITFFGLLTTLKDKFGEDKLKDLDYSGLNHSYSYNDVIDRVIGNVSDPDVAYPLITSNRLWEYNHSSGSYNNPNYVTNTTTNNDIHFNSGAIKYTELFPAVRLASIMDLIKVKYGLKYSSTFFSDEKFYNVYIWFKNRVTPGVTTQANYVDWNSLIAYHIEPSLNPIPYVNTSDNSVNFQYVTTTATGFTASYHQVKIDITSVSSSTVNYYVDVYVNDILVVTHAGINGSIEGQSGFAKMYGAYNVAGLNEIVKLKIRADQNITINMEMQYEQWQENPTPGYGTVISYARYSCAAQNLTSTIGIEQMAPDIKISDFFSGVLREFNLVCEATDIDTYKIEPLLNWYTGGSIYDITRYTNFDEFEITKVPLYKKISFKYQQSSSAMNKYYYQKFNKEYGDTEYQYSYDGGEYNISVPFENLMFNKFTGTNLQVGYCVDSALAPYVPKPIILYKYGMIHLTDHIYYTDGTTGHSYHDYLMFGQDYTGSDLVKYSINWSPETSTYHLQAIQNGLFATYYFQYLYNLYNPKNRLTTVKTVLPVSLLTGLKFNDRVIIRDKRYIINDMKSNLTTGEVTFTLLNDFMPVTPEAIIPPNNGELE